jgi:hypothetical protein
LLSLQKNKICIKYFSKYILNINKMLFKDAHLNFLNYLEAIKNNSQKTIEQYDRHLKKFEEYLEKTEKKDLQVENINLDLVESFRSYLYKGKNRISVKTANAYMITMRSFLKFL